MVFIMASPTEEVSFLVYSCDLSKITVQFRRCLVIAIIIYSAYTECLGWALILGCEFQPGAEHQLSYFLPSHPRAI